MSALLRVLRMGGVNAGRLTVAVLAGSASSAAGFALLGTAAWLISRAAGHPAVVELSLAAVAVRGLALSKAALRYVERLSSHDVALRWSAEFRATMYRHLVPLAPAQTGGIGSGEALDRVVGDVDAVSAVLVRGVTPLVSAALVSLTALGFCAVVLPSSAAGLVVVVLLAGVGLPLVRQHILRSAQSSAALMQRR